MQHGLRPRRPTKHGALLILGFAVPMILILTGLVLIAANLGSDTTAARPAIPQTRPQPGITAALPAAPEPVPTAIPNVDPQQQALAVAQELATDFARHDYSAARAISPGPLDDTALAKQYQPVTKLTVVPVDITPVGPSQFEMRLGLVSQQSSQNIPTTVFYCVDWRVDAAAGLVIQSKTAALTSMPTHVEADQYPTFVADCHRAMLS